MFRLIGVSVVALAAVLLAERYNIVEKGTNWSHLPQIEVNMQTLSLVQDFIGRHTGTATESVDTETALAETTLQTFTERVSTPIDADTAAPVESQRLIRSVQ